ncbi:hypothetical protein LDENG_00013260 [Lucifuga dentata]|nr:hypothetical protein LDENG_00013260 [Lucifuga dentata]
MEETDQGEKSDMYEYDAPSHVTDLKDLQNADNEDSWFEQQACGGVGHLITPRRHDRPFQRSDNLNLPKAIVPPHIKTEMDCAPSTSSSSSPPPSNVVTSWTAGASDQTAARPRRKTSDQRPAQPRRVSKRKEVTRAPAAPPVKKHRSSSTGQPALKSSSNPRRSGRLNSRSVPKIQAAAAVPNTQPNSSEEMELERIRNLQKEVALHRKKNEASYKAALAGNPPPRKLALSTTVPKEFHFSTDTRIKMAAASNTAHKEVDFISQLRKQPSSPAKAVKGATIPKPFNLSAGSKRRLEEPAAYVPMAQQIERFQRRTPERYHLRSRRSQERGPSPPKSNHLKVTQPHTPHLMTRQRSRHTTVKSSAELEAEEVDKLHKFKFKALELNRKILESTESLKKPAMKEPTVPEAFELQIEKRLQERQKKPQEEEEKQYTFKSQPLPTKILEGVVGLPEKKVQHPTVPESPAFALKKRVRMDHKVEEVKQPSPIKAPPVPHFGLPFQPQLPESHHVEVCPFSFEERECERRALKEKRLEEMRNEEVKVQQFKAQPLPDFEEVILPEKKKVEPTKPEPFRLLIDERGAVKTSRWEQMVKEEQKQQEEAAIFKARPNMVTLKEPFQPKKENRAALEGVNSSTVVKAFELSTERRARERQEYERLASEKEALKALMEEKKRQEEEQHEKEEISKLRNEQVHKAQPIRHYKPVALKKSELPLTVPQSPNFSERFRL